LTIFIKTTATRIQWNVADGNIGTIGHPKLTRRSSLYRLRPLGRRDDFSLRQPGQLEGLKLTPASVSWRTEETFTRSCRSAASDSWSLRVQNRLVTSFALPRPTRPPLLRSSLFKERLDAHVEDAREFRHRPQGQVRSAFEPLQTLFLDAEFLGRPCLRPSALAAELRDAPAGILNDGIRPGLVVAHAWNNSAVPIPITQRCRLCYSSRHGRKKSSGVPRLPGPGARPMATSSPLRDSPRIPQQRRMLQLFDSRYRAELALDERNGGRELDRCGWFVRRRRYSSAVR